MRTIITSLLILSFQVLFSQPSEVISKADQLAGERKYEEAIQLLEQSLKIYPDEAELYYWLGRYSHNVVYDSRPFDKKSDAWSKDHVLSNLIKAAELNPKLGDVKYFLAVEFGARALEALKLGDTAAYKRELSDAKKYGGFPPHIIEQGRNILMSCDSNAMLLVDGDAHTNVIQYLQAIEGFRRDVTLICISMLERPFYAKLIRDGAGSVITPAPLNMSDNLIMEMHSYKWKDNEVSIQISDKARKLNGFNDTIRDYNWLVKPDECNRTLSASTAMLVNLFETNKWERPIQYIYYGLEDIQGLEENMQIVGLTARFMPYKVKGTINEYDVKKFEFNMLKPERYIDYPDISANQQPRVVSIFGNLDRIRLIQYANYCLDFGKKTDAQYVFDIMNDYLPVSAYPPYPSLNEEINKLAERLRKE